MKLAILNLPSTPGEPAPFALVVSAPASGQTRERLARDAEDIKARLGARALLVFDEAVEIVEQVLPAAYVGHLDAQVE